MPVHLQGKRAFPFFFFFLLCFIFFFFVFLVFAYFLPKYVICKYVSKMRENRIYASQT